MDYEKRVKTTVRIRAIPRPVPPGELPPIWPIDPDKPPVLVASRKKVRKAVRNKQLVPRRR